jgi:tetratricopeptide (TPR) repeat protein
MKSALTIILLLIAGYCFGQNQRTVDSLTKVLNSAVNDTIKTQVLENLSAEYCYNNPHKAMDYANAEMELARKINYTLGIAAAYNMIGIVYDNEGELNLALENYLQSLRIKEKIGNEGYVSKQLMNIANIYTTMGDYDLSLDYNFRSLKIMKKLNLKSGEATSYNNIGIIYKCKKEYAKAIQYHQKSLALRKEIGEKNAIAASYNNLGTTWEEMKNYDKSLEVLFQAISIRQEINDIDGLASTYINIGKLYNAKKEFRSALEQLYKGLKYARQCGNKEWILNAYGNIVDSYDGMKDYKNEKTYLLSYIYLNDSVFNQTKSEQIISMRTRYETEKKESENKELTQKNEIQKLQIDRNRTLIFMMSFGFGLVLLITFLFIRQNRMQAKQRTLQLEQKLLRSQMNPHFIFNALVAIESFIYKNEPKEAGRYLSGFARLMRLILENSREEYISLAREISTLEHYLQLQRLRFDEKFTYTIELDDQLDPENMAIPPMLAQPFIENSIEHGLKQTESPGKISIKFSLEGNIIHFEVKDNGPGIERTAALKTEPEKHRSLATIITKERLSLLNKHKSGKISFVVSDYTDDANIVLGARVAFAIPYRKIYQ